MAIKISELPESTDLYDGCCLPVVTNGETKKLPYSLLKQRLNEDLDFPSYGEYTPIVYNQLDEVITGQITNVTGRYTKVGNVCFVNIQIHAPKQAADIKISAVTLPHKVLLNPNSIMNMQDLKALYYDPGSPSPKSSHSVLVQDYTHQIKAYLSPNVTLGYMGNVLIISGFYIVDD